MFINKAKFSLNVFKILVSLFAHLLVLQINNESIFFFTLLYFSMFSFKFYINLLFPLSKYFLSPWPSSYTFFLYFLHFNLFSLLAQNHFPMTNSCLTCYRVFLTFSLNINILLSCQICWRIVVQSSLVWFFVFLWYQFNISSFITDFRNRNFISEIRNQRRGTSLVAQWLRLRAPNAGGRGSIPG